MVSRHDAREGPGLANAARLVSPPETTVKGRHVAAKHTVVSLGSALPLLIFTVMTAIPATGVLVAMAMAVAVGAGRQSIVTVTT